MRTPSSRPIPSFLVPAGLLAAVVAIIVGMIGMHLTTGPVGQFSSGGHLHASDVGATLSSSLFSETPTAPCLVSEPTLILDSAEDPRCADISPCPDREHLSDVCMTAPGGSPWAAPLPGLSALQPVLGGSPGSPSATSGRVPASFSPSELSISRT